MELTPLESLQVIGRAVALRAEIWSNYLGLLIKFDTHNIGLPVLYVLVLYIRTAEKLRAPEQKLVLCLQLLFLENWEI